MTTFARNRPIVIAALLAGAIAALGIIGAVAAFSYERSGGDEPVSSPPMEPGQQTANYAVLHQARLDLAERLGINAADISISSMRQAGWNGCLGVVVEDQPCTEMLVGGLIIHFQAANDSYRYHVGGDRFIATDFVDGDVTDGIPLDEPELHPDTNALLATYVRGDLALRLGVEVDDVVIEQLQPVTFPDLCLGFEHEQGQACAQALAEGAIVMLSHERDLYRYHVSVHGIVAVSFEDGSVTIDLNDNVSAVQQAMRNDVADQLGADVEVVSVLAYNNVVWPDGCLGVYFKDALCTQALVEGFVAVLGVGGSDAGYIYHGAGDEFTGVAFLDPDEFRLGHPLPPGQTD